MPIAQYEWTSKKPSIVMLRKSIREGIREGADYIQLTWGENQITLEKHANPTWRGPWDGHGWIGRHGGQDLAEALNEELKNDSTRT